ncbi:unnamed protein product [Trichogramma brassicae]|uniref:Uncharacterized protein n=1 Tax=Trichogramma brassicae TaxID=86971 RepID=A0A6H5I0Y1_9HYME|nr:unnamed protein product [Trichogramma brassicae]
MERKMSVTRGLAVRDRVLLQGSEYAVAAAAAFDSTDATNRRDRYRCRHQNERHGRATNINARREQPELLLPRRASQRSTPLPLPLPRDYWPSPYFTFPRTYDIYMRVCAVQCLRGST